MFIISSRAYSGMGSRKEMKNLKLIDATTISPMGCEHNNWLYRSGLDLLSATNFCYGNYINFSDTFLLF